MAIRRVCLIPSVSYFALLKCSNCLCMCITQMSICVIHIIHLSSELAFIHSSPRFELINILANELFSAVSRPNLKSHASPVRFSCVHLIHRE